MSYIVLFILSLILICMSYVLTTLDSINSKMDQMSNRLLFIEEERDDERD